MGEDEKASIREQLDKMIGEFRFLPAPVSDETGAVLGGGNPRQCKDTRREVRVAQKCISNAQEFNEFLTSNDRRTWGSNIDMISPYLEDNHHIFLTHGDLHPRNIMVAARTHDPVLEHVLPRKSKDSTNRTLHQSTVQVTITAILDWEMCGWYPTYWEYVKALHTITLGCNVDDWWAYSPKVIGVLPKEHAVDRMLRELAWLSSEIE